MGILVIQPHSLHIFKFSAHRIGENVKCESQRFVFSSLYISPLSDRRVKAIALTIYIEFA